MDKDKLHTIKSTGFIIPEHYFETFEDKLFSKLSEEKVIFGIESSGYKVPKDYFSNVDDKILSRLDSDNKPVIKLASRSIFYYIAGVAASVVLMVSLFFNSKTVTIDGIDTAAIENYLYQEDYSNDDFASLFNTNDISQTDFIDVNIPDETLNQYLDNMNTDDLISD